MSDFRIIRTKVFASSNLDDVRNVICDLLMQLNRTFRSRGIEFVWSDNSSDPKEEEIDIALYWRDFGDLPKDKFESAYDSLKAGGNPSRIYVFFRESKDGCEEAMQVFKDSFASKYGHFYCRFEHIDSVKFELAVRCLEYLPNQIMLNGEDNLLNIKENGEIFFAGESIASIENLPFAKLNQKRKILIQDIFDAEKKVEQIESYYKESPDNSDLEEALRNARINRVKLKEEKKKYDDLLFSRAIYFIRESGKEMDEMGSKAKELFFQGRMSDANKILDPHKLDEMDNYYAKLGEEVKKQRIIIIQNWQSKAYIVMLDDSLNIEDRFNQACEAYEKAICIAKEAFYDSEKTAEILLKYADLLYVYNKHSLAETKYNEALNLYRKLSEQCSGTYDQFVALCLDKLSLIHRINSFFDKVELELKEALLIYRRLVDNDHEAFDLYLARTLHDLSLVYIYQNRYDEVEPILTEALSIYRKLAEKNPVLYDEYLAKVLCHLASIHMNQNKYDKAEEEQNEAEVIIDRLYVRNNDRYGKYLAISLNTLAWIDQKQGKYAKADKLFIKSLSIFRILAEQNPEYYAPYLATALNNLAIIHLEQDKFDEAETEAIESLKIFNNIPKISQNAYNLYIAKSLDALARIYVFKDKFDQAEKELTESLPIYRRLVEQNPMVYNKDLANCLALFAFVHKSTMRYDEAEQEYTEAMSILADLEENQYDGSANGINYIINQIAEVRTLKNMKK